MFCNFSHPEGQRSYKCTFSVTNRVIKLHVRWVENVEYMAAMQNAKKKMQYIMGTGYCGEAGGERGSV